MTALQGLVKIKKIKSESPPMWKTQTAHGVKHAKKPEPPPSSGPILNHHYLNTYVNNLI